MPGSRCVVQDCSNVSNHREGISLHTSPVCKSAREKWVRFVRMHRANFSSQGRFMICSDHFEVHQFERSVHIAGRRRFLIQGAVPIVWKKEPNNDRPSSLRSRRMVIKDLMPSSSSMDNSESRTQSATALPKETEYRPAPEVSQPKITMPEVCEIPPEIPLPVVCETPPEVTLQDVHETPPEVSATEVRETPPEATPVSQAPKQTAESACPNCEIAKKEKKKLQRQLK